MKNIGPPCSCYCDGKIMSLRRGSDTSTLKRGGRPPARGVPRCSVLGKQPDTDTASSRKNL